MRDGILLMVRHFQQCDEMELYDWLKPKDECLVEDADWIKPGSVLVTAAVVHVLVQ